MIARGEVWWADLGLPRGSAPGFRRPVLIVSDDSYNAASLRTVTVAAMTGNLRRAGRPGNVSVPAELSGLADASVVTVTQLVTIDRVELEERCGSLPEWLMAQVDEGLRRALHL